MTTMIVRLAGRSLAMGRTSLVPQLCALGARRYGVNGPQGMFTESELSVFDPDVIFTHAEENQLGTTPETKKMVNRLRDSLKEPSWKEHLDQEFDKVYFEKLADFLKSEQAMNYKVFPSYDLVFNAFNLTPLPEVSAATAAARPNQDEDEDSMKMIFRLTDLLLQTRDATDQSCDHRQRSVPQSRSITRPFIFRGNDAAWRTSSSLHRKHFPRTQNRRWCASQIWIVGSVGIARCFASQQRPHRFSFSSFPSLISTFNLFFSFFFFF